MPAYLVAFVEISARARYDADYAPHMQATLEPFGGRYLSRPTSVEVQEGAFPAGEIVLIAFPDMAKAEAWYSSPAYEELLAVRQAVATTSLALFSPRETEGIQRERPG